VGCVAGLALGIASGRLLRGMLFGVTAFDPATCGGTVALILFVAGGALMIPALRAAWVEPAKVLRQD